MCVCQDLDSFVEDAIAIGNALTLRRLLNEVSASTVSMVLPLDDLEALGFVAIDYLCGRLLYPCCCLLMPIYVSRGFRFVAIGCLCGAMLLCPLIMVRRTLRPHLVYLEIWWRLEENIRAPKLSCGTWKNET